MYMAQEAGVRKIKQEQNKFVLLSFIDSIAQSVTVVI